MTHLGLRVKSFNTFKWKIVSILNVDINLGFFFSYLEVKIKICNHVLINLIDAKASQLYHMDVINKLLIITWTN